MIVIKNCPNCNIDFESEKRARRRFCSQKCSAIYNNKHRITKRDKKSIPCVNCGKENVGKKFCNLKCQGQNTSRKHYEKFLLEGPSKEYSNFYTPKSFKPFILEEQDCRCAICSMKNTWNDKPIIFVLDHIDGNSDNNIRSNLRLVCPNCDSQLDTYKSKNKGSGRYLRRQRYLENKSY